MPRMSSRRGPPPNGSLGMTADGLDDQQQKRHCDGNAEREHRSAAAPIRERRRINLRRAIGHMAGARGVSCEQGAENDDENGKRRAKQRHLRPIGIEDRRRGDRDRRQRDKTVTCRRRQRERGRRRFALLRRFAAERTDQRRGQGKGARIGRADAADQARNRGQRACAGATRAAAPVLDSGQEPVGRIRRLSNAGDECRGDDHQSGRIDRFGKAGTEHPDQDRCRESGGVTEHRRDDEDCKKRMDMPPLDGGDEDNDGSKKDQGLGDGHAVHRERDLAIDPGRRCFRVLGFILGR